MPATLDGMLARVVRVEPLTPAWADALCRGDDVFARQCGVAVAEGWAVFSEVASFVSEVARSNAPDTVGSAPHFR